MKCTCGKLLSKQAEDISLKLQVTPALCPICLSTKAGIPYKEVLDMGTGITGCRECLKNNQKSELRRRLLGLEC